MQKTITFQEAYAAALGWLQGHQNAGLQLALIDAKLKEFHAGWVFYYQSAEYLRTGDYQYALAGNAPLFVPRDGSAAQLIGYHRPVGESLDAFCYCGDPNALPNAEVELLSWYRGASTKLAMQAIRNASSLGLLAAKSLIDRSLSGQAVNIPTQSVMAAMTLADELRQLGLEARMSYGN